MANIRLLQVELYLGIESKRHVSVVYIRKVGVHFKEYPLTYSIGENISGKHTFGFDLSPTSNIYYFWLLRHVYVSRLLRQFKGKESATSGGVGTSPLHADYLFQRFYNCFGRQR